MNAIASVEASGSIWDWLWLACRRCPWRQADMIRRGRALTASIGLNRCDHCGSARMLVLERRPHHLFPEAELAPVRLPVVS